MQTPGNGAVGSIDTASDVRKQLAIEARNTPPKHGNKDIQDLINMQHQKLLDFEEESRSLYSRGGSPKDIVALEEPRAGASGVELDQNSTAPAVESPASPGLETETLFPTEDMVATEDEKLKLIQPVDCTPLTPPSTSSTPATPPLPPATTSAPLFQPKQQQQESVEAPSRSLPSE